MTASRNYFADRFALAVLLCLTGVLQFLMVLRFEVNWDEFFLLDWFHHYQRDEQASTLYTIYFPAFYWLPWVSDNEVNQIVAARTVMYGCLISICVFLYATARRFFSIEAALFAVLAFISFTAVFRHATSFRMDVMVTTVLMAAVFLSSNPKQSVFRCTFTGFLIGLAGMITIKAIFYAPIVGIFLIARWGEAGWKQREFVQGVVTVFSSVTSFVVLFLAHSVSPVSADRGIEHLVSVLWASLVEYGFFPQWNRFNFLVWQNPIYWALFAIGICLLTLDFLSSTNRNRFQTVRILACTTPLLTLLFYRHAHPYYYTFMLAPASLSIAASIDWLFSRKSRPVVIGLFSVFAILVFRPSPSIITQTLVYQRNNC